MLSQVFQIILILAFSVAADAAAPIPIQKLSLSRHFNITGARTILERDQARARHLKARTSKSGTILTNPIQEPVNNQDVIYTASIGVGVPPTYYNLIVDTGSSNTWIGANKRYSSKTGTKTSNKVSVTYGSGSFSGTEWLDTVKITSGLVIPKQSIGVASQSTGFSPFDGILGLGPIGLTVGTLSPASSAKIPTVVDNAFAKKLISTKSTAISFSPHGTMSNKGELTWGGVDTSKFTGSINYATLTTTYPASAYWGVDQSISYGLVPILPLTAGIVDTGTTLCLVATDAFVLYQSLTGAKPDSQTGLLTITSSQYAKLKTIHFNINGRSYGLTPNAQIWPRSLNTAIGGSANKIYLIVADIGTSSGSGLDFIDGYTFLERFYTVFDTTHSKIGFATTPFTKATTN
ncbi:acid protease [Amanita muscaria]